MPGEVYLLCERDLQFADLVPEFNMDMCMTPPSVDDDAEVQ